jgi:hypothetical protein
VTSCLASETPDEAEVLDVPPPADVAELLEEDELLLPQAATSKATAATNTNEAKPFRRLNMRSSPRLLAVDPGVRIRYATKIVCNMRTATHATYEPRIWALPS